MAIEYFPCYHSYLARLAKLSDQEVGRLFRALLQYSATGECPELTGRESVAFDFIQFDIDQAHENFNERSRKNAANINKRWNTNDTNEYDRIPPNTNDTKAKAKAKAKAIIPPETPAGVSTPVPDGKNGENFTSPSVDYFLRNLNANASGECLRELLEFEQKLGAEVCCYALRLAQDNGVRSWNYAKAILVAYVNEGVKTVDDCRRREANKQAHKGWNNRKGETAPGGKKELSEAEKKAVQRALKDLEEEK